MGRLARQRPGKRNRRALAGKPGSLYPRSYRHLIRVLTGALACKLRLSYGLAVRWSTDQFVWAPVPRTQDQETQQRCLFLFRLTIMCDFFGENRRIQDIIDRRVRKEAMSCEPQWCWCDNEAEWVEAQESKSIEEEYQEHLNGTREGQRVYHCFGDGSSVCISFDLMSTYCGSGRCVIRGHFGHREHNIFQLRRSWVKQ